MFDIGGQGTYHRENATMLAEPVAGPFHLGPSQDTACPRKST